MILSIPDISLFGDWNGLQEFLEKKGNPLYSIEGDLDLSETDIQSLGNLTSVSGDLNLSFSEIKSLGELTSVGGDLNLNGTHIETLGNLKSVGNSLGLRFTPISKKYSKREIKKVVKVKRKVYF